MLLSELDGFLTGLLVSPQATPGDEWMMVIWGADTEGVPPFEDPRDVQWFASAVAARQAEIARDLSRGRMQPILDVDPQDRDLLWEDWILGFDEAVDLRRDAWAALATDDATAEAWRRYRTMVAVASGNSDMDSMQINAFQDHVLGDLTDVVLALYAVSAHCAAAVAGTSSATPAAKIGRNDPCPCGSGTKHKRCCG